MIPKLQNTSLTTTTTWARVLRQLLWRRQSRNEEQIKTRLRMQKSSLRSRQQESFKHQKFSFTLLCWTCSWVFTVTLSSATCRVHWAEGMQFYPWIYQIRPGTKEKYAISTENSITLSGFEKYNIIIIFVTMASVDRIKQFQMSHII